LASLVIDHRVGSRFALRVEHPLNEYEDQEATSKKTNRSQDDEPHSSPTRKASARIAPEQ
jgi:hypothetical protein